MGGRVAAVLCVGSHKIGLGPVGGVLADGHGSLFLIRSCSVYVDANDGHRPMVIRPKPLHDLNHRVIEKGLERPRFLSQLDYQCVISATANHWPECKIVGMATVLGDEQ
jgi:hypothetical protein